jgi:hypothetical protein
MCGGYSEYLIYRGLGMNTNYSKSITTIMCRGGGIQTSPEMRS